MNVASTSTTRSPSRGNMARYANIILGVWLFISAFAWTHSSAQMTNTWIVGVIGVIVAGVAAFAAPQARYLNTLLAVWLFISSFALPTVSSGTIWNNVIVSILMFVFSLMPSTTETTGHGLLHRRTAGV